MTGARRAGGDIVIALVLLVFAGAYAWLALRLPERNIPGGVGLAFVPLLLAGLLALLAALLLWHGLRESRPPAPPEAEMPGWGRAGAVVGLMVLYVLAMTRIGFLLATPPFLAITMWQAGARRPGFIALTAVGMTAAIRVVFSTLFAVPLPRGPLF